MKEPLVSVIIPTYNRKKDVIECIKSIKKSNYKNIEIIVIDNVSTDGTYEEVKKKFPDIIVKRNKKNLGSAFSRSRGIKIAKGEFLLFIDSDVEIDKNAINELVKTFDNKEIGLAMPLIYYYDNPKQIFCAGAIISLKTGMTKYPNSRDIDSGQFNKIKIIKNGHAMTMFMTKKSIAKKVGGFDTSYYFFYEESDFALKIEKRGYKIALVPFAKAWHKVPPSYTRNPFSIFFRGCKDVRSKITAYYIGRNRVKFFKKHANKIEFLIFCFTFFYFYLIIYTIKFIINKKFDFAISFIKGSFVGLIKFYFNIEMESVFR